MSESLLSIVIPVYNASDLLPGCLDGVLSSNIPGLEILLIDDGSTDESYKVCQQYSDLYRCVRVYKQENAGPAAVRNRGIEVCQGEYISFFDADDLIDGKALKNTVDVLRQNDVDFIASDFFRISRNGCILDRIKQIDERPEPVISKDYLSHFLSDGERVWNVWRYIFKLSFLRGKNLRFQDGYNCAEDLEFIVKALINVDKPAFFHNPYYYYRAHYGDTLTRQYTSKRVCDLMEMLYLASTYLEGKQENAMKLLQDKLVKEYLLNLSLFAELSEADRKIARKAYEKASILLKKPRSIPLKIICRIVSFLGLSISSRILLSMKKVKRWIRKRKIEDFDKNGSENLYSNTCV